MKKSGDHYRKISKERSRRYYAKQKKFGNKPITAFLSSEAFALFSKEK